MLWREQVAAELRIALNFGVKRKQRHIYVFPRSCSAPLLFGSRAPVSTVDHVGGDGLGAGRWGLGRVSGEGTGG